MNKVEALALLKGGRSGIETWNALTDAARRAIDLSNIDLRGAELIGAKFDGVSLAEADFSRTMLTAADFSKSDLSVARFDGAYLGEANFSEANFDRASCMHADFNGANLSGANLRGASFFGSNLTGVNLRESRLNLFSLDNIDLSSAELGRTDFQGAWLRNTRLGNLDLSTAMNLDLARHGGPSTIGTDTLVKSAGKIPEEFLRGCGLADWEIEASKLYLSDTNAHRMSDIVDRIRELKTSSKDNYYSCFISYNHEDKSFARRLHNDLQAKGIRCWLDEKELVPGNRMYAKVDEGIRLWDKVLLCSSEHSLKSWWVKREIDTALEKEKQIYEQRGEVVEALVPLNLDGYLFEWKGEHGADIRKRLAADFTGWETDNAKFEEQFERLVKALRADHGAREKPPEPKL